MGMSISKEAQRHDGEKTSYIKLFFSAVAVVAIAIPVFFFIQSKT